jgi:hypothetical protein
MLGRQEQMGSRDKMDSMGKRERGEHRDLKV